MIKGRVDHKEAGSTCLIVGEVQRFAPSEEEIGRARAKASAAARQQAAAAEPIDLPPVRAQDLSEKVIESLKQVCQDYPGSADVRLVVELDDGARRRLRLGDEYRVENTPTLRAELSSILPASARAAAPESAPRAAAAPAQEQAAATVAV